MAQPRICNRSRELPVRHGEDIIPEVAGRLGFTEATVRAAINSKLVQRTNLQYSKKRKELICVDHQISFK
jgi:hypothetical protein